MALDSNVTSNSSGTVCFWTGPIYYWNFVTWGIISISIWIFLGGLLNLAVFFRWKNKEPFLLYHISLSLTEILIALVEFFGPTSRLLDETQSSTWPYKVTTAGYMVLNPLPNLILTAIGIDRWMSVEYPVFYKTRISRSFVICANLVIWLANCCFWLAVIGFRSYWLIVACHKGSFFYYGELWLMLIFNIQFYGILSIMTLTQVRLVHIAFMAKLRQFRSNHVRSIVNDERSEKSRRSSIISRNILAMMVRTVAAGSVMVTTAVICQVAGAIVYTFGQDYGMTAPFFMSFLILGFLRDLTPVPVYLAFYPHYRACVRELVMVCAKKLWSWREKLNK